MSIQKRVTSTYCKSSTLQVLATFSQYKFSHVKRAQLIYELCKKKGKKSAICTKAGHVVAGAGRSGEFPFPPVHHRVHGGDGGGINKRSCRERQLQRERVTTGTSINN